MLASFHHQKHPAESQEILSLLRLELMLHEERNDVFSQMARASDPVGHPVAVILANHSATEVRLEGVQHLNISFVLHHGELRKHLNAAGHAGILVDADMKAAFTITEACDPFCL